MDEEVKTAEKQNPKPKKSGKPEESAMGRLAKWWSAKYGEYKSEFKKVVWPSRTELLKSSITVVVICAIFGAYLAGVDTLLGWLFTQFARLLA